MSWCCLGAVLRERRSEAREGAGHGMILEWLGGERAHQKLELAVCTIEMGHASLGWHPEEVVAACAFNVPFAVSLLSTCRSTTMTGG